MSLALIHSRALLGLQAPAVTVEVHLANGLPSFTLVGLADTEVKEARERVRCAIQNTGLDFPSNKRITVNLAPADLPKDSGRFDLPIALGILAAHGLGNFIVKRFNFACKSTSYCCAFQSYTHSYFIVTNVESFAFMPFLHDCCRTSLKLFFCVTKNVSFLSRCRSIGNGVSLLQALGSLRQAISDRLRVPMLISFNAIVTAIASPSK